MFNWIRHWPRHALVIFAVAAAVFAVGCWRTWALIIAKPHPTVDTIAQLDALTLEGQPEGENAWDAYVALFADDLAKHPIGPGRDERPRAILSSFEPMHGAWDDIDRSDLIAWLDSRRDLLDRAASISELNRFAAPYTRRAANQTAGQQWEYRTLRAGDHDNWAMGMMTLLAQMNAACIRVSAHEGDWDDVIARIEFGLRLVRQISNQPTQFESLRAINTFAWVRIPLAQTLQEVDMPVAACERLIAVLEKFEINVDRMVQRAIDAHEIVISDGVQWFHTRSGVPLITVYDNDVFRLNGFKETRASRILSPWSPGKGVAEDQAKAQLASARQLASIPVEDFFNRKSQYSPFLQHPVFLHISIFSADSLVRAWRNIESHIAGLRVMLRLEIDELTHNRVPHTLLEAMSPEDAIDPVSGERFVYELSAHDPAGRAYVLSVPWQPTSSGLREVNPPRTPLLLKAP